MRSPKAPRRRAVICASNEPNEYACIFTRRMPQQPTECWLPQSWSAPNHTGDATPSPLRFGRCRANVHWTFCTPALAAASNPFVDLPSGDTLRCKLFPADKFYKISLYFDGRIKYNEVNDKSGFGGNMLMKKFLSLFLCLTCVLTLVACGKKVAPITLPQTDEITSIDITFGENTVSHSDKTWISEIIADISSSEPTKKESVQDCPQVESYIKIDFQFETGTSTIFAYEDSGKYYIEQPYQGIYKIDSQLFERLQETD